MTEGASDPSDAAGDAPAGHVCRMLSDGPVFEALRAVMASDDDWTDEHLVRAVRARAPHRPKTGAS
jgi:hypothetical protein